MSDIKSESFESNGMHYGATGAMHDESSPAAGTKIKEMLTGAPMGFSGGVSAGQQSPVSGS